MTTDIFIPKFGAGIDEVKIGKIYKKAGDKVSNGEAILEVITDKATFEIEAEEDGVIKEISCREGDYKKVLEVIGKIE